MLGIAFLRLGRFAEAETPLWQASTLGDPLGRMKYGDLLRNMSRFDEAIVQREAVFPGLTGEVRLECLRWWGVAEF